MEYLTKVIATSFLKRKEKAIRGSGGGIFTGNYDKFWEPQPFKEPKEGVVIGKRTLSNGISEFNGEGITYEPKESLQVYVVSLDMRTNPIYVLPTELTKSH